VSRPTTTVEVVFDETPVLITGDVVRTNLVINPNFETDTTGWSSSGTVVRTTAQAYIGVASVSLTYLGSGTVLLQQSTRSTVTAGLSYTASFYMKQSVDAGTVICNFMWYNSAGSVILDDTHQSNNPNTVWQRFSQTRTAPTNAVSCSFRIYQTSGESGGAVATVNFVDAVLIEQASSALPYFDGTFADAYTNYALSQQYWNGTADASTATTYWASTDPANLAFTLNDSIKGVLNNPFYLLDGHLEFEDVSADVQQVTVSRGRSRQLDQYSAGSATVDFISTTRKYDPLNTASPYYPYVTPSRYIRVTTGGIPIFGGVVNSWSLSYEKSNVSYTTASCSDSFSLLANQTLGEFTPDAELAGARINTVLNRPEVDFTSTFVSVDAGTTTMGAFLITEGTSALNYLRQVESSEQGFLFSTANDTFKFKDRSTVLAQTGGVSFSDTGTPTSGYMTLDVETGDDLLYNRVVGESEAGVAQIVTDATSIAVYGVSSLEKTDLLNSTTAEVLDVANLLLAKYKEPEVRYTGLSQNLNALSGANQVFVLGLDLTDLATVTKTYATGSPASITKYVLVEGINHTITPSDHTISFRFASLSQVGFILNSGIFGLLDISSVN